MKCPLDGAELVMTERQGIEIDYCPTCRGVWLDRGELDKLIERTAAVPAGGDWDDRDDARYRSREHDDRYSGHGQRGYPPPKSKRKSLLGELFDID